MSLDEQTKKKLQYLAGLKEYEIEGKKYKRNSLSTQQLIDLERARERLLFDTKSKKSSSIDTLIELYVKQAEYYLGMSRDTFMNLQNFEEIKMILDSCVYRTSYSLY